MFFCKRQIRRSRINFYQDSCVVAMKTISQRSFVTRDYIPVTYSTNSKLRTCNLSNHAVIFYFSVWKRYGAW